MHRELIIRLYIIFGISSESYAARYRTHQYNRDPYHPGHKRFRMDKLKRPRKDDTKPRRPKNQKIESKLKPVRRPLINKRPRKPPGPKGKKPSKKGISHEFFNMILPMS